MMTTTMMWTGRTGMKVYLQYTARRHFGVKRPRAAGVRARPRAVESKGAACHHGPVLQGESDGCWVPAEGSTDQRAHQGGGGTGGASRPAGGRRRGGGEEGVCGGTQRQREAGGVRSDVWNRCCGGNGVRSVSKSSTPADVFK